MRTKNKLFAYLPLLITVIILVLGFIPGGRIFYSLHPWGERFVYASTALFDPRNINYPDFFSPLTLLLTCILLILNLVVIKKCSVGFKVFSALICLAAILLTLYPTVFSGDYGITAICILHAVLYAAELVTVLLLKPAGRNSGAEKSCG